MIVDAHLDIAHNALDGGRGFEAPPAPGYLVSRPALAGAGVGLVLATIFCRPAGRDGQAGQGRGYRTAGEAHFMARAQLGYYQAAGLELVRTRAELETYRHSWRPGRLAAVLLMEGADPVESPAQLGWWAERGVRVVGLSWSRTRYAGGTHAPGGVTELGVRLLRAMRRRGLILDLSHLADRALDDALELWKGPLVASHANARSVTGGQRELPDPVLAELGRRGGVVGVSFYGAHLGVRRRPRLDDVATMARALAEATGGPEHVGLGSDLDGGFGADRAPLDSLAGLPDLARHLRRRFNAAQVEGIMGGNWLDLLGRALPLASQPSTGSAVLPTSSRTGVRVRR
ncbi:MAG: dipeptidase [Candidatus Dormibacterales bacterium]